MLVHRVAIATAVVGIALMGACGGSTKVGDENSLNVKARDNQKLGQITTTTASAVTTTRAVATTAPRTVTTRANTVTTRGLTPITIDEGESAFNPVNPRMRKGTLVRVVNRTSQTVNFTSGPGGRWKGDISPGATFTFTADVVGSYTMTDDNRPFMQGTLEVVE